jgi:hypothetical protein
MIACEQWHFSRLHDVHYIPAPRRGTHFDNGCSYNEDFINGCYFHSATGKLLPKGDYEIGNAVAGGEHDHFKRMVYLPTARDRLIYDLEVRTRTATERLSEVTATTLQRYSDLNQNVTDFALLDQLDPRVVSQLAGSYFQAVEVRSLYTNAFGVPSQLGMFCLWLADHGTHEAIDGLIEAADAG